MFVGVLVLELEIFGAQSLKEKRFVLKSLLDKLPKFNVSVAETRHQDLWQRAEIAVAAVGSSRQVVEATLQRVDRTVESTGQLRVIDQILTFY
ncbi:MAG: DUF503 domain-containing protein [Gemmatimonadetes bacterium]|nr:DUF503 domain-containing protein [Gemmatimonadota bacterium]